MSEMTTRGIHIQVTSAYLPERSSPQDSQYFFTYRVRISNVGTERAQLISRAWVITDSDGNVQEVRGPGVVGEQPVLAPGHQLRVFELLPAAKRRSARCTAHTRW